MSRIYCYRNGTLEIVGIKDIGYKMTYYRNKNNKLSKIMTNDFYTSLEKFKKIIDTEGF